jgi:PIN domain nuclease of toxin-antitoxin system
MRILLDTHAVLWWLVDDPALGENARSQIAEPDNVILVSTASLWEIAIKQGLGKIEANIAEIEGAIAAQGMLRLGIDADHLIELVSLPHIHRDPFDRMLVAQARAENVPLMTADGDIAGYSVDRIAADR